MSDDIVKRLRDAYPATQDFAHTTQGDLMDEAADRIYALTTDRENRLADLQIIKAERDAAYANGYSDAETEISQSVLGLENTFLHSQYADAKLRIEDLQAQTMRLSGMVHDLKKEVAISDALLIGEAEASLERLARAEVAEAERDQLREALDGLLTSVEHADFADGWCCCGDDMLHHQSPMDCGHTPVDMGEYHAFLAIKKARAALKGESND